MAGLKICLVALSLLLLGDFVATFGYHVPQHVFGRLHGVVHHGSNRSFILYALRHHNPWALIPGFFSAFPYLMWIPILWLVSPMGVMVGLVLAEMHVIWRHQFSEDYCTPNWIRWGCRWLGITTPERHLLHHRNGNLAFGDIFAFYGPWAHWWLKYLRRLRRQWKVQRSLPQT